MQGAIGLEAGLRSAGLATSGRRRGPGGFERLFPLIYHEPYWLLLHLGAARKLTHAGLDAASEHSSTAQAPYPLSSPARADT